MVLLICAGIITFYLPRAWAVGAWVVALVFTLPRLMSGAHWLSDNLVGSLAIAVFVLTWVLATPLHGVINDAFERLLRRLRRPLARNPNRVSIEDGKVR